MLDEFEITGLARTESTTSKAMIDTSFEIVNDLFRNYQNILKEGFSPEENLSGDSIISLYAEIMCQMSDLMHMIQSDEFTGSFGEKAAMADIVTSTNGSLSRLGSLVGLPPSMMWGESKPSNLPTLRVIK